MRNLTVTPLARDKIAQCFALLRHADPSLTMEQWSEFAKGVLSCEAAGPRGITAIHSEQDYILGLFCWRVDWDLRHARVLVVENFHAMDLLDPAPVAREMARNIEEIAQQNHCRAIHTHIGSPAAAEWIASMLENTGHKVESRCLCKVMEPT